MSAESTGTDDTKPLVWLLDQEGDLNEWLATHPPSRIGAPPAFNNGVVAAPIWVLNLKTIDQLAELSPSAITNPTFTEANQMARDAAAKVDAIQHDDEIPTKSNGKSPVKSKKQCRTEVQDQFHDQIMLMSADHPLWNQGRWTLLVKPAIINDTFATLASSLASGELKKHGSIIALRARTLRASESFSSSRKSNLRSPTSVRYANETPLGIDIFFQPVWNSTAARDVLRVVAGVSGKMASFCKSSLYSRLGIRNDHTLGAHASLYNSKTLASPADAKQWVEKYRPLEIKVEGKGSFDLAESLTWRRPASAPELFMPQLKETTVEAKDSFDPVVFSASRRPGSAPELSLPEPQETTAATKRELETESAGDAAKKSEEPVLKKARNGDLEKVSVSAKHADFIATESQPETQESPDEPMLPIRSTVKATDPAPSQPSATLISIAEKDAITAEAIVSAAPRTGVKEAPLPAQAASETTTGGHQPMEEESQTQVEPPAAPSADVEASSGREAALQDETAAAVKQPIATELDVVGEQTADTGSVPDLGENEKAGKGHGRSDADVEMQPPVEKDMQAPAEEQKVQDETKSPLEEDGVAATNELSAVEEKEKEQPQPAITPPHDSAVTATNEAQQPSITKVVHLSHTVEVVIPWPGHRAETVVPSKDSDSTAVACRPAEQSAPGNTTSAASADIALELKQPDADVSTTTSITAENKESPPVKSGESAAIVKDEPHVEESIQPMTQKEAAAEGKETKFESPSFESDMVAAADAAESANSAAGSSAEEPSQSNGGYNVVSEVQKAGEPAADKAESQQSVGNGAEKSLDELIVEGVTASLLTGSQLLNEDGQKENSSEVKQKDAGEAAVTFATPKVSEETDNKKDAKGAIEEVGSKQE